jgi:hypothetical protein
VLIVNPESLAFAASPGFESKSFTVDVGIPEVKYPTEKQAQFYRDPYHASNRCPEFGP